MRLHVYSFATDAGGGLAEIHPFAWIINQSFLATGTRDPLLAERAALEMRYIQEVEQKHTDRVFLISWKAAGAGEALAAKAAMAGAVHE